MVGEEQHRKKQQILNFVQNYFIENPNLIRKVFPSSLCTIVNVILIYKFQPGEIKNAVNQIKCE